MIVQIPKQTSELWEQLEAGALKLPAKDRNLFVLDLIKFCIDWQFAYLELKEAEKNDKGN